MSSKYHGLPDIDTAPDVFETGDEPESVLRPNDGGIGDDDIVIVKPHSELIDAAGLPDRGKAEKVFGRGSKRRDPSDLRFRPRLPPSRFHHLSESSSDEEAVPKETPAARIRRLKAELAEVEAELKGQSSSTSRPPATGAETRVQEGKRQSVLPPREPLDLVGELAGLKDRIGSIELGEQRDEPNPHGGPEGRLRSRLESLTKPTFEADGLATYREKEGASGSQAGLSEIDQRLAVLERLIGASDIASDSASSPLITTLNKHDHLLTLLTQPRHLDAISRRVKLLLVDLDRAAAAARRQGPGAASQPAGDKTVTLSNTDYASLQSLFGLLPRLDPLLPIIPPLLARLQSLSGLHAAASDVADGLIRLQKSEKKDSEEMKELSGAVEGVQRGLDESGKMILSNWEGVEKRMKDLEERMKKLNP